jgi:uncharacterized membrane protein YkoI
MNEEIPDTENDEFTTPHLPERYHQAVRAKRRRRLMRRALLAGAALLVVVVIAFLLMGIPGSMSLPAIPAQAAAPATPAPAATETPGTDLPAPGSADFTRGPGLAAPLPAGLIPLDSAIVSLRSDLPASGFTITAADLTTAANRSLYAFTVVPKASAGDPGSIVYIDASTGSIWSPGEEGARISRVEAKQRARVAVPGITADTALLAYSAQPQSVKVWEFSLISDGARVASGRLNAETGAVVSFEKVIATGGRPGSPSVNPAKAEAIANQYIIDQNNGQLPLNLSVSRYDAIDTPSGPVAGRHTLIYERMYQDFLTDTDGFVVVVDAVTGDVTGYTQSWTTPDHAFAGYPEVDVVKREATFAVMQKAKEMYPDSINSLQVVSASVRWKNDLPYGSVPRPGTIPLGWKVVFDDDVIRNNASAQKGVAWVDVQSGEFIAFDYRH